MANTDTYINKLVVPNGSNTITANLVDTVSGYTKYNYFEIPISYNSSTQKYYTSGITWTDIRNAYAKGDYIYGKYSDLIYQLTMYVDDDQDTYLKLERIDISQQIEVDGFTVSDLTDISRNGGIAGAGTVTSVGLSNATNGGLSITGSPITSSGSITVGHSNILSAAQTTSAIYPITYDKNGHITGAGTGITLNTSSPTKFLREDGTWQTVTAGVSDVKVGTTSSNASSIVTDGVATLLTNTAYNSSSNKIATMSDLPSVPVTDVQLNGTSILSSGVANIVTNTAYNSSTNKIATMADVDAVTITYSLISGTSTSYEMNISSTLASNYANTILGEAY